MHDFKNIKFKEDANNQLKNIYPSEETYLSVPDITRYYTYNDIFIKEIKKRKRKKLKIMLFKEFILFIIIIISIVKYKKSLKITTQDEKDFDMDASFVMSIIYDCLKSASYTTLALFLIEFKICKIYQLFFIILVYLFLFITNTGENLDGHGTYNTIFFLICITLGQILIMIFYGFSLLYKKWKKFTIAMFIIFFTSSFIIYKTEVEYKIKCKNWDYGLNQTKINNDKTIYPCNIIIPNHNCYLNFIGPFFDFSKGIKCTDRKEEEKKKLKKHSTSKNINKNTKRIGFPITTHKENYSLMKQKSSKKLYKEIMNNLVDMDDIKQLEQLGPKERPEIVLDYTKYEFGEIHINISYDQDLSMERKKLEKNSNPLYDNIIFIFLDGISRRHFTRAYKKSAEFIEKFMSYDGINNEKSPNQRYHGFQFLKMHSFREFTLGNTVPMFYGKPYYAKNATTITAKLKNKGFVTCGVNGICDKETFYFDWQLKSDMLRNYVEFDHEMFALNCDPNYYDVIKPHSIGQGESSVFRRCLYGKENIEYLFEYGTKFLEAYKTNRKYLRFSIPNGHELSGQVSKYVDEPLYQFLNYIYNNDLLKNTSLIIASDHGLNIYVLYKLLNSQDQDIEVNNPLIFFILPDKDGKTYNEQYGNLAMNQQTFVTSFDIYHTLRHILYGHDSPITKKIIEEKGLTFNPKKHFIGSSLFSYIDPKERYCQNYIDIQDCICRFNS